MSGAGGERGAGSRGRLALALGGGLLGGCSGLPSDGEPVSAQRPTLSSDTATTVEGTFELELGATWDPGQFWDTPTTLKYGSGPSTEVFLGWSPYVWLELPGENRQGIGDLLVGIRHRFHEATESSPSAAVQTTVKLPTADEDSGVGTGELDASFAGIVTRDLGGYFATGYYALDVLGEPSGGTVVGHAVALASTTPLVGRFAGFGEIAGVFLPELDFEPIFSTLGVTYNPRRFLVFDVGVAIGLNEDAPDLRVVVGLTENLGGHRAHRRPSP